ncbi:MAG: ATPase, partial [Bacteroidetes bacterium]
MNIQTGEQNRQISAEDFQSPPNPVNATPQPSGPQFTSIQTINESVQRTSTWVRPLEQEIGRVIVGQKRLIERLLVGILSNGHILLEGVPGLAKTLVLNTLASAIQTGFRRIQFTPD